jgi:hypothetical protein
MKANELTNLGFFDVFQFKLYDLKLIAAVKSGSLNDKK